MSKSRADGPAALSLGGEDMAEFLAAVVGRGASFRFKARGMSMWPFIRDGDVLTVAPLGGPLRLGDIAAFKSPSSGRLVIHRFVGRKREAHLFKGDAAGYGDGPIPASEILGRIVRIERGGRSVRLGMNFGRAVVALWSRANPRRRLGNLWAKLRDKGKGPS